MLKNPTNDPKIRSFVAVASDSHFPIQNLPYGLFRREPGGRARIGVAIGEMVLDLSVIAEAGLFNETILAGSTVFAAERLNDFLALGAESWSEARRRIHELLRDDVALLRDNEALRKQALVPASQVEMVLPVEIGDYTDFYSSREHATNVGVMFRGKENALMPNWLHLPVAYHGRASSVVLSGTPIVRPKGQTLPPDAEAPVFGPSRLMDHEFEVGFFVGPGNELGRSISVDAAPSQIFGFVLVNDWSARDIQKWEYQPLGPFLAKNFGTSISPWIVTLEALEPFRCAGPEQDPTPLPYLQAKGEWSYDIRLETWLKTEKMDAAERIAVSNYRYMYWNICQQLAHHTVSGCPMAPGDLLASGTISGQTSDSRGSMLELTWRGSEPLHLSSGEERKFFEDGDEVILTGWAQGEGYRVGFGDVRGKILPALD